MQTSKGEMSRFFKCYDTLTFIGCSVQNVMSYQSSSVISLKQDWDYSLDTTRCLSHKNNFFLSGLAKKGKTRQVLH